MNEGLALRLLEQVMDWDNATAVGETTWLRLMSQYKYDSYRDYLAGARFVERLADWLQQFAQADRQAAYDYVRTHLVFISLAEMRHLIDRFYPEVIEKVLIAEVAGRLGVPSYLFWKHPNAQEEFEKAMRKTLFLGLSDGARMDTFRRLNEGRICNEQVLIATQINEAKWIDVLKKLRQNQKDDETRFVRAFLIDDFVGSGKTLLRWDKEEQQWDGKLWRFWDECESFFRTHFEPGWVLHVHHYLAGHEGAALVKERNEKAAKERKEKWFSSVRFTFGLILPRSLPIDKERDAHFWSITERYYDPAIQTKSTAVGGDHVRRGFGACGLPVILEHNTPNNSLALLWAETTGRDGYHRMRPLFRRAQRHW